MRQNVGCLLIGDGKGDCLAPLEALLRAKGVAAMRTGGTLAEAQDGLVRVRRQDGVCIAAEGEMWAVALSLAAQLQVERIALIAPEDRCRRAADERERQLQRLKAYARRNLFFCISGILLLERSGEGNADRRINELCRRLCNANVRRMSCPDPRAYGMEPAARFLLSGSLGNGREALFSK